MTRQLHQYFRSNEAGQLSARAYHSTLKLTRTIADLTKELHASRLSEDGDERLSVLDYIIVNRAIEARFTMMQ